MSTDYGYEVDHDDHDRLLGPSQEEPDEEPPVDLEEIEAAFDEFSREIGEIGVRAAAVAATLPLLPLLFAELRDARAEADQRASTGRHEFTVTDGQPPADDSELVTAEQAAAVLNNNPNRAVWGRPVYADPWYRLSKEPPFSL